ncbi:centromere kinetochore component CENP-T-domain-containing protein [Podospora appendiculata]|uniref:Centromere kinetochore component CENP-T-domain-containing protein n=1 Tax=Podospora appendiculata TaxID=314037 RepID=A0AAE0XIA0_9PEZI|nr:centromere kinetochore component CENP-T-domain-containing protein [Podospora appendiculata]
MARESRPPPPVATPARRAVSAEPPSSADRRSVKTPVNQGRTPFQRQQQGLSASARKPAPPTATPHARAAFRTIDSRRAAIHTPHRAKRRQSVRDARETPRNFLLSLGRALAKDTQPIASSSSSPGSHKAASSVADAKDSTISEEADEDIIGGGDYDDDDDDEDLPRRPRLSLPIDVEEDDDDDIHPHRSMVLDDENFTVQSIEMPRRAISEQPGGRFSLGSTRMSDYFNNEIIRSDDVGIDSGFFPPINALDEANFETGAEDMTVYDRLDSDVGRNDTGRASDFGMEMPVDMNEESTFVIAPQIQDSPTRQPVEFDGYLDLQEQRSDDYDDEDDDVGNEAAEEINDDTGLDQQVELGAMSAKSAVRRSTKKRGKKISQHGIEYPSLPPAVVKRLAQTFAKTSGSKGKIAPDALQAIMQASEWFFEQLGDDLAAYANHAHRKTIDESDMLTLMKRQRQTNAHTTLFSLAQRHLPRELLQELRMTPAPVKQRRKPHGGGVEDEDVT